MSLPVRRVASLYLSLVAAVCGCSSGSDDSAVPSNESESQVRGVVQIDNSINSDPVEAHPGIRVDASTNTASTSGEATFVTRTSISREGFRPEVIDRTSSEAALAKGDINFDDLKFDIEKGEKFAESQLTERVKSLNGRKVKLSGFILPSSVFVQSGIDRFVLVRDDQECCFGPGAALYDCVFVNMTAGNTAEFSIRPVTVEGEFKIDTETYRYPGGEGPDGASHLAVFEIKGVRVK